MSANTARERALILFLPAFAVVALYAWLGYAGNSGELERLDERVASAQESEVTDVDRRAAEVRLRRVTDEAASLQERVDDAGSRLAAFAGGLGAGSGPTDAMADLTSLLIARGLRVVEEGPLAGQNDRTLPPTLRSLGEVVRRHGGRVEREVWSVRFEGAFPDVVAAMRDLSGAGSGLVPVVGVDGALDRVGRRLAGVDASGVDLRGAARSR